MQRRTIMDFKNLFKILKLVVIVILLVFYYQFFFLGVFEDYNEGLTNMATKQEVSEGGIEMPAISICLSPLRKLSKMQELNITESFFVMLPGSHEHLDQDLVMEEVIEETSFKLGEDFEIEFGEFWPNNLTFGGKTLGLGMNSFSSFNVILEEFVSMTKGKCYLLTSKAKLTGNIPLILSVTKNVVKDTPEHVTLTATSKPDYLGNIMGTWKNLNPFTIKIDFGTGNQAIDLRESYTHLITSCDNTVDSFHQCIRQAYLDRLLKPYGCHKCIPMVAKSVLNTTLYPSCQNLFDEKCNVGYFARESGMMNSNCQVQCQIKEYTAQVSENGVGLFKNDGSKRRASVMLVHTSESRTVTKEYLIYNTAGMVGNIGGSLGLFLGCSFLGVFSDFLDFLRNKLSSC